MSQPKGKVPPHITPKKFSHPQENVPIIIVLKEVDDPRKPSCNFRHSLVTIIFISLIGVLCGARDWEEIAQCAEGMAEWLGSYVNLSGGIPLCQNAEACLRYNGPQKLDSRERKIGFCRLVPKRLDQPQDKVWEQLGVFRTFDWNSIAISPFLTHKISLSAALLCR